MRTNRLKLVESLEYMRTTRLKPQDKNSYSNNSSNGKELYQDS